MPKGEKVHPEYLTVSYFVQTHYAFCPTCGHKARCFQQEDGTYTLTCGCMCDGAFKIEYLINPGDVVTVEERKIKRIPLDD